MHQSICHFVERAVAADHADCIAGLLVQRLNNLCSVPRSLCHMDLQVDSSVREYRFDTLQDPEAALATALRIDDDSQALKFHFSDSCLVDAGVSRNMVGFIHLSEFYLNDSGVLIDALE